MLKEKLNNTCSFRRVWKEKGEERYAHNRLGITDAF